MTITTEQAEQLALTAETLNRPVTAAALRSLAADRDAWRAEVESLLGPPIDKAERKKNLVAAGVSDKTADEMLESPVYDRHSEMEARVSEARRVALVKGETQ
jgi:hypothetical protein